MIYLLHVCLGPRDSKLYPSLNKVKFFAIDLLIASSACVQSCCTKKIEVTIIKKGFLLPGHNIQSKKKNTNSFLKEFP